ncbi:MAG: hypothetical protein D6689_10145 [Deltaproteobacteria bacterium]|nr:MAG: hypothetical protein D6689_10145 [Deltaproteobacteria bacterium]
MGAVGGGGGRRRDPRPVTAARIAAACALGVLGCRPSTSGTPESPAARPSASLPVAPAPRLDGDAALAAALAAAPGRIWFAERAAGGDVRMRSMTPGGDDLRDEAPADAAYYPGPGRRALAIAVVEGPEGADHREQLAVRDATGRWRRVGPVAGVVRRPSAPPAGDWAVVETSAASFRDLYRVDLATGAATRITFDGDGAFDPDVSPRGDRIAFVSTAGGDGALVAIDPDGGRRASLVDQPGQETTPRWSPDGTRVAFCGDRDGPERLFVVEVASGQVSRVTGLDAADRHECDPVWSPDGQRIAYLLHHASGARELWVARVDRGAPPVRVSRAGAAVVTASWSPDGAFLAYDEHTPAGRHIEIARADGSARVRLRAAADRWLPRWRP